MSADRCRFCGAEGSWPTICKSSRDMEDFSVEGAGTERGERCYGALASLGGGEMGLSRIDSLRPSAATLN